jgi:hypothetical protein
LLFEKWIFHNDQPVYADDHRIFVVKITNFHIVCSLILWVEGNSLYIPWLLILWVEGNSLYIPWLLILLFLFISGAVSKLYFDLEFPKDNNINSDGSEITNIFIKVENVFDHL